MKVLGIIALIVDPETKEVINLAYEPFVFLQNGFGVRLEFSHFVIVIGICSLLVLGLGLIICLLRRSAFRI